MKIKRFFLAAMAIGIGVSEGLTQNNLPGSWKAYLNHTACIQATEMNGIIYTLTSGGMFAYEPESQETKTFSTIDGMSGINPTAIYHAEDAGNIFIGYEDGMIDYYSGAGEFGYFSQIQTNTFYTQKRINEFFAKENRLYVATDFGLVVYNLDNGLPITDVTQFGVGNATRLKISSVTVFKNRIYVLVQNSGIFSANENATNLKDPAEWTIEDESTGFPTTEPIFQLKSTPTILLARSDTTTYFSDGLSGWEQHPKLTGRLDRLYAWGEIVGGSRINRTSVFYNETDNITFFVEGGVEDVVYIRKNVFLVATRFNGLLYFDTYEVTNVTPDGPRSNDCVRIAAGNGELYVAPKGYDQAYTPEVSTLGVYYYNKSAGWTFLDQSQGLDPTVSTGFARVVYDDNSGNTWAGSWGSGLVELQNGEQRAFYNCQNAGISTINANCNLTNRENSRVSGIDLDFSGNLWMSLDFAREPLMVRNTDGQWLATPSFRFPQNHHITDMIVDDYGNKWMVNAEQGLLVYLDNNTPLDFDDDRVISLKAGLNQGNLPTNQVYSLAKDMDGFVWVGTGQGVTVFYDPFSISQGKVVDASPPVFERRPLLKDAIINAITVDGGNRKWFATNDGVFLMSEDGDQEIYHFNEENSPLLSDAVNDIAVDNNTGEVFFATARGIISFQGDATTGETNCNEILVYPNPVFTDYEGVVTIRGTGPESRVKITSVTGMLVKEILSQGGTAIWDGRDVYGNKVKSGVYLALISNRNGDNGCVGKFTVIAR
ncbi:MAG: two-component regulator propeller domain-containing protein [Bacteroidia bacterium]